MIDKPTLSIDRVTLLIHTGPVFSFFDEELQQDLDPNHEERNESIKRMCEFFESFSEYRDKNAPCSEETKLYQYHFRLKGGIDLQFCPKFGIKHRINDESYVVAFGSDDDLENGYCDEYFHSDYGIRIEYNPNKDSIIEIQKILTSIGNVRKDINFDQLVKVSRLDIAVDYPLHIMPEFITSDRSKKFFLVGGANGVESSYFNSRRSRFHWRIYNKALELKEKDNINYSGNLWRIELESKPSIDIGEDVQFFANQFGKLHIWQKGQSTGDYKKDLALHYANCFGMHNMLNMIPRQTRVRMKRDLIEVISKQEDMTHPKFIVGWYFHPLWQRFYEKLKFLFGREGERCYYPRNEKSFMTDEELEHDFGYAQIAKTDGSWLQTYAGQGAI